ncbi:hypothetical protein Tco_0076963, partial [Tanacetum coccineum]
KVSTDKIDEGTAKLKNGNLDENATPTVFRDDEIIVEFLVSMSQNKAKQKGVEINDAEDSDRSRTTSTRSLLTLKPLPKIDPKDKGKKVLEEEAESDAELEDITEAEKKFKQLTNDEEVAKKARLNADKILIENLQEEEREREMSDDSFIAIGSAKDEKIIKEMNEQAADASKKRVKKDDSVKGEIKEEEGTRKRKLGKRKKMKSKKRKFTSKDDEELRLCNWCQSL